MIVSLIVAMARDGVIGRDGDLPWRLPDELRRFKALTMGHHLVVGRRTWESIGRPLPGRTMVVLTRRPAVTAMQTDIPPGVHVVGSLEAALELAAAAGDDECFVGGGAEVYRLAMPHADRVWLTHVHADVDGDVRMQPLPPSQWNRVSLEHHPVDERHAYAFDVCRYDRVRP